MKRIAAIALVWLLVCLSVAGAAGRELWRHKKGFFAHTKGKTWEERIGKDHFTFVEWRRTDVFVEIYDKSRDCRVRLHKDHCLVSFDNKKFERYYDGKWE